MSASPKTPEDFLELVERAKRGRLKLYLGFAAGVGKTYRMLEEAHSLRRRGIDVVIGLVETHARGETAALVEGLEVVPRKHFEYRGVTIEDMDLRAVLARRPQVAVVDEVAHTNAPGSEHRKRYQDVLELCDAGINVICAFNVQHLESLKDMVERATGVVVRETVPDTFVRQADQVITLDLAVEDLLERLRSGKIYGQEKIAWAREHFFKDENLTALRELVLREVAESVERAAAPSHRDRLPRPTAGKVMVCMSSYSAAAPAVLRRGSRVAGRLSSDWYVVYVETPDEAPERIDATRQRHLHANIELARELGAEVVRLKARDPVPSLLDFARSHGVGHLIVGRSHQSWWRQRLGIDVVHRIYVAATDIDLHIVPLQEREAP
ncbi:MAG: universal stress protein [Deltaproteobacteria bacterium]|nr:universal stress protein [Nannocystaceae bacterium]